MPKNVHHFLCQFLVMLYCISLTLPAGCEKGYYRYSSSKTSGFFESYSAISYHSCAGLCTDAANCKGFVYNSLTAVCSLAANDDPVPVPDSPQWSFSEKMCLSELLLLLPPTTEVVTTTEEIDTTVPFQTSLETTTKDVTTTKELESTVPLETTVPFKRPEHETTTEDVTTIEKLEITTIQTAFTPSTVASTALTEIKTLKVETEKTTVTTESPETSSSSELTITNQTPTGLTTKDLTPFFLSSYCQCVCEETSETLSKRIAERQQDLRLDRRALSSYTRKLKCAQDNRPSSTNIGYLGVVVLITCGFFIFFPDIIRIVEDLR